MNELMNILQVTNSNYFLIYYKRVIIYLTMFYESSVFNVAEPSLATNTCDYWR